MRGARVILSLAFAVVSMLCAAAPARHGVVKLTQSDGSVVEALIRGDEFGHVMTTLDGCAISWGDDGLLYYATYSPMGEIRRTDVRLGGRDAVQAAAASRDIPYQTLSRIAASNRSRRLPHPGESLLADGPRTRAAAGSVKTIVIPVQFADLPLQHTRDHFVDLLTKPGYDFDGASGSVLDYFNDQFQGATQFVFDVAPVVTLSHGRAYYGADGPDGNDVRAAEAVAEACSLSDAAVDFSKYDYVYVFYAGGSAADGGADSDSIWPHSWDLQSAGIRLLLDGRRIIDYAMSPELMHLGSGRNALAGIGTFCHEFSHCLGLPDLYDTDYEGSGGYADALWRVTSIMDGGNYNNECRTPPSYNCMELERLGLIRPEPLTMGRDTLAPLQESRRALRFDGATPGEYYLFECRYAKGWDKYIMGSGILIYHVDKSENNAGYSPAFKMDLTARERWSRAYNEVNCRPEHQCADLVEAFPGATSITRVFFPYSSKDSFHSGSDPAFVFWDGTPSSYHVRGMTRVGQSVAFTVSGPVTIDSEDVFQEEAVFNWHTSMDEYADQPTFIRWKGPDGRSHEAEIAPYEAARYAYTIEGLEPGTSYSVELFFREGGAESFPTHLSITTLPYGDYPFVQMHSSWDDRADDTKWLPLKVFNARGRKSVSWYWNDTEISVGPNGYYEVPKSSGRLKAVVEYNDGTRDVIVREVNAK